MSEFKLSARSAFGLDQPLDEQWEGFAASEIENYSIWWMSVSRGGADKLSAACEKHFGCGLPEQGMFTHKEEGPRILFAGDRQWFVAGHLPKLPAALEKLAAVTDQSDGWVGLRLEGQKTRDVLEKICLLDLHPSVFGAGTCARMPIEGMHALLACEDAGVGHYTLLFQRSSARSLLEHIRHAANSACGGPRARDPE